MFAFSVASPEGNMLIALSYKEQGASLYVTFFVGFMGITNVIVQWTAVCIVDGETLKPQLKMIFCEIY